MSHETEPATQLRNALVAEARTVTAGPAFTERVIGAARALPATAPTPLLRPVPADDHSSAGQHGWRGWILPVAAAAVVAVLLAAVLVGSTLLRRPDHQPPATQLTRPPSPSISAPAPSKPSATSKPAPSKSSGTGSPAAQGALPPGGPVPAGFRAVDLTWVSTDIGFALGTAPCTTAPCTSILRTADGGKSWVGLPAPKAMLGQTDTCSHDCDLVTHLRFANPQVGYAFSFNSLFLTTDGGRHWAKQAGGSAYSLEIVDGTVLRVVGQAPSCAPGCDFTVQRSAIGGTDWQDVELPAGGQHSGAQLAASGRTVVLATFGHTAGGAENQTSVLFTSTDSGATWRKVGEPCPHADSGAANGEVDTVAVTVAPDQSITALCTPRGGNGGEFTVTSTDAGAHWATASARLAAAGNVLGAASAGTLLVSLDHLYRSTDGGRHWTRTGDGTKGPDAASWIGFENSSVGRVLEVDGPDTVASGKVWTTTDAGRSWTSSTFG
jgi:hypothetical protein